MVHHCECVTRTCITKCEQSLCKDHARSDRTVTGPDADRTGGDPVVYRTVLCIASGVDSKSVKNEI